MPSVRKRNAATDVEIKSDYLYCGKRSNKPRIHHLVCENNCRYSKNCIYYRAWVGEPEKKAELKKKRKAINSRKRRKPRKPRRKK